MLNSCQLYHCCSSRIINSCQSDVWLLYLYRILSSADCLSWTVTTNIAPSNTSWPWPGPPVNQPDNKLPPATYKVSKSHIILWWDCRAINHWTSVTSPMPDIIIILTSPVIPLSTQHIVWTHLHKSCSPAQVFSTQYCSLQIVLQWLLQLLTCNLEPTLDSDEC